MSVIDNIAHTCIERSRIHGFGLFAKAQLEEGELLCKLDGQRVPWAHYAQEIAPSASPFVEWNALSPQLLLVRMFRTKYSFINHSREPNCKVLLRGDQLALVTRSAIEAGEELTLDYRDEPLPPAYASGHGAAYL